MRKRWQAKVKQLYSELKRHIHDQISEQRAYLQLEGTGHSETKRLNSSQMFTDDPIERNRVIEGMSPFTLVRLDLTHRANVSQERESYANLGAIRACSQVKPVVGHPSFISSARVFATTPLLAA